MMTPLDFQRNAQIQELNYDTEKLDMQKIVVYGNNVTSENIVLQLLSFGFKNVYLWSSSSEPMKRASVASPYYRNMEGILSLEAKTIRAGIDGLAQNMLDYIDPTVMINTENKEYISDALFGNYAKKSQGIFIDARTIMDHKKKLYGLNIQTAAAGRNYSNDLYSFIEKQKDLSLFEGKKHDPLMAIICASYVGAAVARYALDDNEDYFISPSSFILFPFANDPHSAMGAKKEIHYKGFFGDKMIYIAGLGGGNLALDALINIFDVNNLFGVDIDILTRNNFNRLYTLAREELVGKPKAQANAIVYKDFAQKSGKNIEFKQGLIIDNLYCKTQPDIIFGFLSGFNNKLNLMAISQRMAEQGHKHVLIDAGNSPFNVNITTCIPELTPCDYCLDMHDRAITEFFAKNVPSCSRYPDGSTIFANQLNVLAIIEAMKSIDPKIGGISNSIAIDLLPEIPDPNALYRVNPLTPVENCSDHWRTTPLIIDQNNFIITDGYHLGWHYKIIHEKLPDGKGGSDSKDNSDGKDGYDGKHGHGGREGRIIGQIRQDKLPGEPK